MEDKKIPLVCVVGPTASGKTALSVALAERFGGEVVSADSMQIYRHMNIGTAKPTSEEKRGVAHHCIDIVEPDAAFSVAEYVVRARAAIAEIHARGALPILAGGTGLYVSSVVNHIEFAPTPSSAALRAELKALGDTNGNEYLWKLLESVDPTLAAGLHPNNQSRVIRGIEIYRLTGITMTEHQRRSRLRESPYRLCMLGLCFRERETLYNRINRRVGKMLEAGLLDELGALKKMGYSSTSVQAIGYKEFFDCLDGKMTLEAATERVRQESRRYAKRQLTWFKRDERVQWLAVDEYKNFEQLLAEAAKPVQALLGGSG